MTNYITRVISIEPYAPGIWRVVAKIIGSKELITVTLPVEPSFKIGEQLGIRLEIAA